MKNKKKENPAAKKEIVGGIYSYEGIPVLRRAKY